MNRILTAVATFVAVFLAVFWIGNCCCHSEDVNSYTVLIIVSGIIAAIFAAMAADVCEINEGLKRKEQENNNGK